MGAAKTTIFSHVPVGAASMIAAIATVLLVPAQSLAVEYGVIFDATWSSANHPGAYPSGAHFSPLIGAMHTDLVRFWDIDGIATPGIESMAETGSTSTLRNEFLAAGVNTDAIILGSGLGSPGSTSATFNVEASHSLVTLVTMVAPSPDWFVGVSGIDLFSGGRWVPQLTIDLFSHDAGTDSGLNFTSPNADTQPAEPIALSGAPFTGANTSPLGTFTFTLLGDIDLDGDVDGVDFLRWQRNPSIGSIAEWQTNYGTGVLLSANVNAVPEPSSAMLLVALAAIAIVRKGVRTL